MNEGPIDRASTISEAEVELMERVYDASYGKFHGDVRLSGADLRRAKRLVGLEMMTPGHLSAKHYALTPQGTEFVIGLRRRRTEAAFGDVP